MCERGGSARARLQGGRLRCRLVLSARRALGVRLAAGRLQLCRSHPAADAERSSVLQGGLIYV